MEAILLIGIQGAGKSTFYKERFFDTHVRLSLDVLKTRNRETLLVQACLFARAPFVVDNTNVLAVDRARFIVPAREAGFRVSGYFFPPDVRGSIARAKKRARTVPVHGILGTSRRLQAPTLEEGFDRLFQVRLTPGNGYVVEEVTAAS